MQYICLAAKHSVQQSSKWTVTSVKLSCKADDTHSNKLRQLMAQLSCAIKLLQQLRNCVSNKLPKQTWIPVIQTMMLL